MGGIKLLDNFCYAHILRYGHMPEFKSCPHYCAARPRNAKSHLLPCPRICHAAAIYSILGEKSKSPEVATIKKICDGLEITLGEFFSTPEFDNLEQEIK